MPNSFLLDVTEKKIGEIVPHIKAGDHNIKQKKHNKYFFKFIIIINLFFLIIILYYFIFIHSILIINKY